VEITLENPPSDVRPDLSATARIITDTRTKALSIPIIALTVRENTPLTTESRRDTAQVGKKKESEGVFIVANGKASFRAVKVGIAGDEYFEVLEGVTENEEIVAGPYQSIRDLKDGTAVRPTKQATDTTRRAGS
jgi:HlyD family secretion protein